MATYPVTFVTETSEIHTEAADDQYLLDAAGAAGLELPFMCLQGWCTTCAGRILEGRVDQSEARRIYPQDEEAGFVLLCSAIRARRCVSAPIRKRKCAPTGERWTYRRRGDDPMTTGSPWIGDLLTGPLGSTLPWPFTFHVRLCDLRPRFLPKCVVGSGYRAVAHNGRILLCGDRSLDELAGQFASVRLQTWHRTILPGESPQAYGVLLCVRCLPTDARFDGVYTMHLVRSAEAEGDLRVDVGGGMVLDCRAG